MATHEAPLCDIRLVLNAVAGVSSPPSASRANGGTGQQVHWIPAIATVLSTRTGRATASRRLAMTLGIAVLCALHRIPSRAFLTARSDDSADQG